MPSLPKPYHVWSIFLLKEECTADELSLNPKYRASVDTHIVTIAPGLQCKLFVKKTRPAKPAWMKLFANSVSPTLEGKRSSVSALLLIPAGGRSFAITFGFGRSLMLPDCWEQEFGLKVVLNSVNEESIREIELSGFDSLLQNKQAQSVRNATIDEFEIDVDQDVIRSLKGTPTDVSLGRNVSGRDALQISTQVDLVELPELLVKLLAASEQETYLEKFSWVGRMKEVRSPSTREQLDSLLIQRLLENELSALWIAPPEYTRWKDGASFKYPLSKELHEDIYLPLFLNLLQTKGKLSGLDTKALKRWTIEVVDQDGYTLDEWTVYRCLYAEVDFDGKMHLLSNGGWFSIDNDYLAEVNTAIDSFPVYDHVLPEFNDADEGAYNTRVSITDARYALMDKKTVELRKRGLTKIEFCDLFTTSGDIIHVKRYSGSSELSHLFAQGMVSAELFIHEPEFREALNLKLPQNHKLNDPGARITPSSFHVVYGIVSRSANDLKLPFFSKVMLRNAQRRLGELGLSVSLCKIQGASATALNDEDTEDVDEG